MINVAVLIEIHPHLSRTRRAARQSAGPSNLLNRSWNLRDQTKALNGLLFPLEIDIHKCGIRRRRWDLVPASWAPLMRVLQTIALPKRNLIRLLGISE
jgi:hypothetical protein